MTKKSKKQNEYELIPLDLTFEEIGKLALSAHNRDMKLNDYLVEIIMNADVSTSDTEEEKNNDK